ncbi:MAG: glycine cleavage system protein GcvH [Actinobacteria bacterium]|nr:MAG: glycine cleavage system protein GcvH [Actinomycetota bacterium]
MTPAELWYTREHEWLAMQDDGTVRIGITDFAQDTLGGIVFVALPNVGDEVAAGASFGEVESHKSVSEVYAPVAGTITARNDVVETAPETINEDPYGAGWLVQIRPVDEPAAADFLDAAAYDALAGG